MTRTLEGGQWVAIQRDVQRCIRKEILKDQKWRVEDRKLRGGMNAKPVNIEETYDLFENESPAQSQDNEMGHHYPQAQV